MTWTAETSRGNEAAKVKWELVPYMRGRVLDIGCGCKKAFPQFTGVDSGKAWGLGDADILIDSADSLPMVAGGVCDMVFSSHLLEHVEYDRVPDVLREWFRVTKTGGHVVIYVPDEDEYPKVGAFGANPDHKWNVNYEKVVAALDSVECSWDMVDFQKRNSGDEYSLLFVVKKL